jgi:hypothetical protein
MKLLSLVLPCLIAVGCNNPTKEFQGLADRACKCAEADTGCGSKVLTELATFAAEHKAPGTSEFNQAGVRLNDCLGATGVEPRQVTAALEKLDR